MTFQIDSVKSSEVHKLRDISITTFRTTFENGGYSEEDFNQYFNEAYDIDTLLKELDNKHSFTYFFREDGEVTGYFKLNILDAQTEAMGEEYLEIQRIYFLPHAQGGGRGKYIIDFAESKAKELNKTKIWLGVWEYNEPALKFYTKHGLKVIGRHEFQTGEVVDSDLVMEKIL
ncbi:GNAT family N-acetyltransferase [Staphylococcus sp. ACRSN]|uniref:GNAT family N-acetyltransferase n=1 Tax=Staphylococcus sp. ACRSN TaxID=2918214 RepID=UPI001EF25A91|nr:GNAT family N-acetyltransferase [Staphylococcus sp. ACRSN]MCG7338168.1 GNAT family N-acetyltransferase [Staphylococcus sp. ACRSN]